jgi:hypothetical protein
MAAADRAIPRHSRIYGRKRHTTANTRRNSFFHPVKLGVLKQRCMAMLEGELRYLYSSGPVSPLVVWLFLVRQEPFTRSHIQLQGNRFDVAERIFSSISSTFDALRSEATEFWELIPEFYYCFEFLMNSNAFDLGIAEGKRVEDVELPTWAKTPSEFIYLHRKALESRFVSQNLHHWINLIWGVNQKSLDVNNVYHPNLYADIWESPNVNKVEVEIFTKMVGQIPRQLFAVSHPQKQNHSGYLGPQSIAISRAEHGLHFEAAYFEPSGNRLNAYLISKCQGLVPYTITFENSSYSMIITGKKRQLNDVIEKIKMCGNRIVVVQDEQTFLHVFPSQGLLSEVLVHSSWKIESEAASGEWFSATSDDFITTI